MVKPLLDRFEELVAGNLKVMGLHDGVIDRADEDFLADFFFEGRIVFFEEATFARKRFDDALAFEFGIGFGDGVAIDAELFREGADGGEGFAGLEGAGSGGVADLIGDLEVNGFTGFKINLQDHSGLTVLDH